MATTHHTSPPFTKWNDTDHAGPVIIVTTLCLVYWAVAGIGQQVLSVSSGLHYTWADGLFTLSMASSKLSWSWYQHRTVWGGQRASYSQPKSPAQKTQVPPTPCRFQSTILQVYKASNIFYIICLGCIKCSAACFTANLTVKNTGSLRQVRGKQAIGLYGTVSLSAMWMVASIVALGVPCKAYGGRANAEGMCLGTVSRWVGIFVGDWITDIAIVGFAANVIWRTNASVGTRLTWYIPFLVRACVPLWAGPRILTIDHAKLTEDPTISLWLFICMSQAQILLAPISAASPVLKKAMLDLVTHYGAATEHSQSRSHSGPSIALKYLTGKRGKKGDMSQGSDSGTSKRHLPFSGSGVGGTTMISRSRHESKIRSDGDSQEGIIRQDDFEVTYAQEDASSKGEYGQYR